MCVGSSGLTGLFPSLYGNAKVVKSQDNIAAAAK